MTRVLLVRHAKPVANWDVSDDSGLDDLGHRQATALSASLAPRGPLPVITSPLRRAQATAAPLAAAWSVAAVIEPGVSEIPSVGVAQADRRVWLQGLMAKSWPEVDQALQGWRESLLAVLHNLECDTVVVTHFVVINAVVGACIGDERVLAFAPAHTSVTEVDVVDGELHLVQRGAEAVTSVR